ncbi:MAG: hypothetical protein LCH98_20305 [Actinobacteria bacterium]|nr:hypothetical protein [Actinomycetota bacterium]
MTPDELRTILLGLPASCPISDDYKTRFRAASTRKPWYAHQKEHWLGWLAEYSGPGAYGRARRSLDAKHAYNHFQCPPGLIWMAEALGEDPAVVARAVDLATAQEADGKRVATQCRVIREQMTWPRIEALCADHAATRPTKTPRLARIAARRVIGH